MGVLAARSIAGLPEIAPGDDLVELMLAAGAQLGNSDIVVISHKAVSKAEGRTVALSNVTPSAQATEIASQQGRDPRHVQVILDESSLLVRCERGVIIARTRQGFVCANAGVDASNAPAAETLVLLPSDPDGSARGLRARMRALTGAAPAVLITDSFGRAWRHGQQEIAIGCAGLKALDDWRGRSDSAGRELSATWIALADQIASAADLTREKSSREPIVIVSGLARHITREDGPGAQQLIRPPAEDLFC